ncbi:MAG: hypothetical protein JJ899_08825 [Alphaproteobacteria bacterium]|nr:hypothetical protein [Alphaproteobacteria bacterium]
MSRPSSHPSRSALRRVGLLAGAMVVLAACGMNSKTSAPVNDVSFRESRFQQMQKIQAFEACRDEGLMLDSQARSRGSTGAFITSARVLSGCTADLGDAASAIPQTERMRVDALAVTNYFKGGDVEQARRRFDAFKASHSGSDLYFGDGSSFIETTELLLGRSEPMSFGTFAAANVNDTVKREMRRMNHWKDK